MHHFQCILFLCGLIDIFPSSIIFLPPEWIPLTFLIMQVQRQRISLVFLSLETSLFCLQLWSIFFLGKEFLVYRFCVFFFFFSFKTLNMLLHCLMYMYMIFCPLCDLFLWLLIRFTLYYLFSSVWLKCALVWFSSC